MRSTLDHYVAFGAGVVTVAVVAFVLYRPRVQHSQAYQATVVPLANIMDVGFILFAPAIVLLAGFRAPLFMLGICLVAMAAGFAIAYNIRNYEPIAGQGGPADHLEEASEWALLGASVVNIAYYTIVLIALALLPFGANDPGLRSWIGAGLLVVVIVVGASGGMDWLNRQGDRTTAFNLAAVVGIVVAFLVFNLQDLLDGRWEVGEPVEMGVDDLRKMIGLFAIVQGFEASRYIGVRFGAELRISTMRVAQVVSTGVFVVFVLSLLVLFLPPTGAADGTAILEAADEVGGAPLPWLLLLAAIGSQTSAIIGATSSRSDMLVNRRVPRKLTFPIILVPAALMVVFVDLNVAVNLASRVFAAFFTIQASLAAFLAYRRRRWRSVAGFAGVLAAMVAILVLGLPL
ncbi:MAG: hypothetical protein AB1Z57_10725 [Acidimicrobiia bacterium]